MAARYWVGGTASWDGIAGTKWATTSGGAGGAAVPTTVDDVFFDAASGAVTVTASSLSLQCQNFDCTGFTGTITGAGGTLQHRGTVFKLVPGMTWSNTSAINFFLSAVTQTVAITTAGKSLGALQLGNGSASPNITWSLQDALTSSSSITLNSGTFTTNNYNVTASSLSSSNSNTRTINLGSSTVTLTGATTWSCATSQNLTFNAGTSTVVISGSAPSIIHGSNDGFTGTFYNVSMTNTGIATATVRGSLVFNNLTIAGRTSAGISIVEVSSGSNGNGNPTINGTLTLSAGTNATIRTFVRSDTIGTTRTLTCAAVASLQDIDFRDITIAGAAAPVSGTRLGDCKGNSGITFPAAKTVWFRGSSGASWGAGSSWSLTNGGTAESTALPLAQDTAVFPSSPTPYPASGGTITINAAYNIGTIDMSARTSNTMTLATSTQTPAIYGNWINGTGTTLSGTGTLTFAGRGSQTITSAGKTFTQRLTIDSPGGSLTLLDALNTSLGSSSAISHISGTFDAASYNVTMSSTSGGFASQGSVTRTLALGSGTWTLSGTGGWNISGSNLTVTGTGTISLTSASAKTFAGGGIQTYPTLNQGGTGTLTVTGSNKFAGLTNTAIGRIQFTGGTTNEFTSFTISGASGNLLQLGSTNTTQAILKKPSAWNVGANSTDAGNNTGLSFTAGGNDYLSVSYINGQIAAPASTIYYGATNITNIRFGSAAVSAVYYGSTKVF